MDFILEHKWAFLIAAEVVFWVSILAFLVLRYWFQLNKLSFTFFGLFIINDLWIATMGFMDYLKTGNFTNYQLIIIIVIIYAFTYGKKDFKKLDRFIQKKVAKIKGEPVTDIEQTKELSGEEHAKMERKHFYIHFFIFAAVHLFFLLFYGLSDQIGDIHSIQSLFTEWFVSKEAILPFTHSTANNISRIWGIILVIDGIISFSYTLFPKKSKNYISS